MKTYTTAEQTALPVQKKTRNVSLDIIRCVAILLVITVHFCLNIEFYANPCVGTEAFFGLLIRTVAMICVPLFLILSGYLVNKKTLSKKYYKGIIKVLGIYLIASIACGCYSFYVNGQPFSLFELVTKTLNFRAASYSWYVEMYIGLFLMIPFLNLAYHGLETKKKKLVLVLTFIALTNLPSLLNIFKLNDLSWFANPALDRNYHVIVPDYWGTRLFPLTYYFIGCYLREFPLKINKWLNLCLITVSSLAFSAFNYYRNYNSLFLVESFNDNHGFQVLILAVLVFSFVLSFDTSSMPRPIAAVFRYISEISFSMYLLSQIADSIVYKYINASAYGPDRIKYIVIAVPAVFVGSVILATAAEMIYKLFEYSITFIIKKLKT